MDLARERESRIVAEGELVGLRRSVDGRSGGAKTEPGASEAGSRVAPGRGTRFRAPRKSRRHRSPDSTPRRAVQSMAGPAHSTDRSAESETRSRLAEPAQLLT